ncbi:unnamed protein product [Moneuplotes crassus]|uniref:Uncharacterized protein n=1 Tax=Euplotes crassus TaxID=5936 RepID=A0AAD1UN41_EUPCR|nr:unnamed protein product [Moneuplotes crassus]
MRRVQGKDVAKKGRNSIFSSRPVHKFLKRSSHLQQLRFKNTLGSRNPELSIKLSELKPEVQGAHGRGQVAQTEISLWAF